MVCVAAFIVLCLIGVFVLILSFWFPKLGKRYLVVFKKAWGCVGKRLTLQKCDTNFKEDIKNSVLRKVIIKKPKLVKPISFGIEVLAVIIVFITIFSFVEVIKSGLSLYVLGTCNVSRPDSCILGEGDVCPVNLDQTNWFEDWVIIFQSIPDRVRNWNANDYVDENSIFYYEFDQNRETVLNIFEPLCGKCADSFRNQYDRGFFEDYNVALIPYPTKGEVSTRITSLVFALHEFPFEHEISASWQLISILFTGVYQEGLTWQDAIIVGEITEDDLEDVMKNWLSIIGFDEKEIKEILELAASEEIHDKMFENKEFIDNKIRIRGVPTTIWNGRRNTGIIRR